jgi:hypothetical protein
VKNARVLLAALVIGSPAAAQVRSSPISAEHLVCAMVGGQARCMHFAHFFLGNTGHNDSDSLRPLDGDPGLVSIRTSGEMACGLTATGALYCEGMTGGPGEGPITAETPNEPCGGVECVARLGPVASHYAFRSFAMEDNVVCGSAVGGSLVCWGLSAARRLARVPRVLAGAPALVSMDAGSGNFCGLTADGRAWCWTIREAWFTPPNRVAGAHTFVQIEAGGMGPCGLEADGGLWCWQRDGELAPLRSQPATRFRSISIGDRFSCGILMEGGGVCWGENVDDLGNGMGYRDLPSSPTPVPVLNSGAYIAIAAGDGIAGGLTSAGDVYYWGTCHCDASGLPQSYPAPRLSEQPEHRTKAGVPVGGKRLLRN